MKTKILLFFGIFLMTKTSIEIYQSKQKESFRKEMKEVFVKNNISLADPDVKLVLLYCK